MTWILLAGLTAFFESLKDVAGKKSVANIDATVVAWSMKFFAIPMLLPLLLVIEIPPLNPRFWMALGIGGSLNVITVILYMKALRASDLSLTVPMLTFTPIFLLLTSPIILGEFPSLGGIIGIALIVLGSYLLNVGERHKGFLAPFRALARQKGSRMMLLVAFIWSISSNFDKIGVQNSSPLFWCISTSLYIMLAMVPIVFKKLRTIGLRKLLSSKYLMFMSVFFTLSLICQMTAVNLTLVVYVIALKRTSVLMCVLWGHLIFKEHGLGERLMGTLVMLAGVLTIAII